MTRKQAIKALFNQNKTEAIFGRDSAQQSRALRKKREEARDRRYDRPTSFFVSRQDAGAKRP